MARKSSKSNSKSPQQRASRPKPKLRRSSIWVNFLNILIWCSFLGGVLLVWFAYDLPSVDRLLGETRRPNVIFLARDGQRLGALGDFYGAPILNLKSLPAYVPQAVVAIEDRRFFDHRGIDVIGIARALYRNLTAKGVVQGGSTITQQLAKNFLLSEGLYTYVDRSLRRKVQEVLLAFWLETHFSKEQILTLYLNRAYFGGGAYGLSGAAQRYFNKPPTQLTLYESALLAGLLKAPTKLSPAARPERAHERAQTVLRAMQAENLITEAQMNKALREGDRLHTIQEKDLVGRYFIDMVMEELPFLVGAVETDLIVETTLDFELQQAIEAQAAQLMATEAKQVNCNQVSVMSVGRSGAIRALVGGKSYLESQFNRATQAERQTGSAFKLLVYLCALEAGFKPDDRIQDTPIRFGTWQPKNYGWQSQGEITLEQAFAHSVNTVSVRLAAQVGVGAIHKMAERLGITAPLPKDLTIALGTASVRLSEMMGAFGAVFTGGYKLEPFAIVRVRDRQGKLLYTHPGESFEKILSDEVVADMRRLLAAVVLEGTGHRALLDRPSWGKSGTTQHHRDAWFIGFTDDLLTGVWVGNDQNEAMNRVTGGKLPAKLWQAIMRRL